MVNSSKGVTTHVTNDNITCVDSAIPGWQLALQAEGKSPRTITSYISSVKSFARYFDRPLVEATTHDLRAYVAEKRDGGHRDNTILTRARALKLFYRWLVEEGDIEKSPAETLKVRTPKEVDISVLSKEQQRSLISTVKGSKKFLDLRDYAIIMVMLDTGVRRSELIGMKVSETDSVNGTAILTRKGGGRGIVYFGANTRKVLARYIRRRHFYKGGDRDELWLTIRGTPLKQFQVWELIKKRGEAAGIPGLHPHQLRHTFASEFRRAGGSEGDLMVLGGWRSRSMLDRYGRADAQERAKESAERLSLGDRL